MRRQAVVVVDGSTLSRDVALIRRQLRGDGSVLTLLRALFGEAGLYGPRTFDEVRDVLCEAPHGFEVVERAPSTCVLGMPDVEIAFVTVSVHPRTLRRTLCVEQTSRYFEVSDG